MERLTRQQRQRLTRDRLLDAAARLFAERGLVASLDDVATAAGLTKGAVYSNFANKESLILALIERRGEKCDDFDVTDILGDTSRSVDERMAVIADLYQTAAASDANRDFTLLLLEFWAAAIRGPRMREVFVQELRRIKATIEDQLTRCASEPDLPLPVTDMSAILLALDIGLHIQHLVDPQESTGYRYSRAFTLLTGAALEAVGKAE